MNSAPESSFADRSYQLHEAHLQQQQASHSDPLTRLTTLKNTIHEWRHTRMYETLRPLLAQHEKWITIGDGIGTDAHWLRDQQVDVLATDIGDALLKLANERGFIGPYSRQNAEKIEFNDNTFDYSLCKEAWHHFPRPYLAIYEMLRVSRKGIILIEPQDPLMNSPMLLALKNLLYRIQPELLRRIWRNQYSFEEVGNYVYKISEREIEKVAMGMGLPAIAVLGLNDYVQNEPEMSMAPPPTGFFNKVKRQIAFRNLLSRIGLAPWRLLVCVIFKQTPDAATINQLRAAGFSYIELPPNPYA